jgi:hypothetical protein
MIPKYCPECGSKATIPTAKFCSGCGTSLNGGSKPVPRSQKQDLQEEYAETNNIPSLSGLQVEIIGETKNNRLTIGSLTPAPPTEERNVRIQGYKQVSKEKLLKEMMEECASKKPVIEVE